MSGDSLLVVMINFIPVSTFRLGGGEADVAEIKTHPFFDSINWEDLVAKKVLNFTTSTL